MNNQTVLAIRQMRQNLTKQKSNYDQLFKLMSPVQPVYWSCPGEPPQLVYRADFDDATYCFNLRARREIVKGRFQSGNVAYVFRDDLDLFASCYRKQEKLSFDEEEILSLLKREGPMNIKVMKEFTGMLAKRIVNPLHKLQEKFLVFEDQIDNEWDRGWFLFSEEFSDCNLERFSKQEALKILILRFCYLNCWFNEKMVQSFYKFNLKDIKEAIQALLKEEKIITYENGYITPEDLALIENKTQVIEPGVFVLHRNDYLVKCNEYWLKEKYGHQDYDILQYLLIDGDFHGAVLGKFHNGPFDVEDVILDYDASIDRDRIILEVNRVLYPSHLKRFQGKMLE